MMQFDPLEDGKSDLTLIRTWETDLDLEVVNDAKASYQRESSDVGEKEIRLINRLISGITEPQHTSPLRGVVFKFKVKCPLFTARQIYKHHVASSYVDCQDGWNETSYRYVTVNEPEFYIPKTFYTQDKRNKQASAAPVEDDIQAYAAREYETCLHNIMFSYKHLLVLGVSREQARALLPASLYTSFHWTVSLQALLNFIDLREGHGAQTEIVKYAECLKQVVKAYSPYVFQAWEDRKALIKEAMELHADVYKLTQEERANFFEAIHNVRLTESQDS